VPDRSTTKELLAMAITFEVRKELPRDADALVVPALAGEPVGYGVDGDHLRIGGFTGQLDQLATVPGEAPGRAVIVVGVGPAEAVDEQALRRAAAVAARASAPYATVASRLLDVLPAEAEPARRAAAARALAEGSVLGAYRFDRYKSAAEAPALSRIVVVGPGGKRVQQGLDLGARIGAAVALARDLVNDPGGSLTPVALAAVAADIAEREGLELTVLDEDELVARGLGGLLGVNRGSTQPPRLIRLAYEPDQPRGHLALVGKGITFDSGGLSIKSADGMMTMKDDMGGAAAILGAMSAVAAVAPRCRVTAWIPSTDNMPGPDATRPGDVLRIYGGTTVEVLNTDAEGRLVLADALVLASEAEPDAIVDLATLTGSVLSALGSRVAGLFGNDDAWLDQVRDAAGRVGERVWPLPLPEDYRKSLDSDVADLRNISRMNEAGAITAALFLREFVGEGIPWAHLDIAGTAWSDAVEGELVKGGTGFGVRTLLELARAFHRP
jgi:leucyl aminopeptidase